MSSVLFLTLKVFVYFDSELVRQLAQNFDLA